MSESAKTILETEWSYFLDIETIEKGRKEVSISPSAEEAARLCQRLGLVGLQQLDADLVVLHGAGQASFHATGQMRARVVQNCVVTNEPVVSEIEEQFEGWFADTEASITIAKARHEKLSEKGHGELPILEEFEDPEPLQDGKIDLGELVTQHLSLAINPYPHAEGVEFEDVHEDQGAQSSNEDDNPFAALKDWKDKLTSGEN